MRLTVTIPIFNEAESLPELCDRLHKACDGVPEIEWSVLFVDDGSSDNSVALMLDMHQQDPRFGMLRLSRNFGHQAAIAAGLAYADADAVIVMDGDLQDPPELIPEMVQVWREGGQVVRAVRTGRSERGLRRIGFDLFHKLFDLMIDLRHVGDSGVFALLDRRAVDVLNHLPERNRFLPGLRSWIGFDQRMVSYDRTDRTAGAPKQTLTRLIRYALDAFFSFSYQPLRLMTYLGIFVSSVGFLIAVGFVIRRLTGYEIAVTGFTTLVTLILFLGGIQLIGMGVLGEYIGRIFDEVKQRPLYVVGDDRNVPQRPRPDVHIDKETHA